MAQSIEFAWDPADFDALLRSCRYDDGVRLSLEWLINKQSKILEAGCGLGRVVKYLHDLGFQNVWGIELNEEAVAYTNREFPELRIVAGDLLGMDMIFGADSFDYVLSFGVVEHFPSGLEDPLKAIWRVLRPGGIAIVTVPSLNTIRRIVDLVDRSRHYVNPRRNALVRKVFRKKPLSGRMSREFLYYVYPPGGPFFEYRLTPKEFESACIVAGFQILKSVPISHIDGLYHLFGARLVKFENWEFEVSRPGAIINNLFRRIPFFHNHMHACVLKK